MPASVICQFSVKMRSLPAVSNSACSIPHFVEQDTRKAAATYSFRSGGAAFSVRIFSRMLSCSETGADLHIL